MTKVFNVPHQFENRVPQFAFQTDTRESFQVRVDAFTKELKDWLVKRNPSEYVGEIIQFPVADGYAMYMVAALKPVELVHIPLLDAYQFQYANRLTKKDVVDQINQQKRMKELFSKKG